MNQPDFELPEIDPRFNPLNTLDDTIIADTEESDKKLWVQFYVNPIMHPIKSTLAGRPVFDEVDYIKIRIPGSQLSVIDAPYKEYAPRFAARYKQWKSDQKDAITGTPIENFPFLLGKIGLIAELKAMNVMTVEQLAGLNDGWVTNLMGGIELRKRAQTWLDETTGVDAQLSTIAQENNDLKAQMSALQEQMAQLLAPKPAEAKPAEAKPASEVAKAK